MSDIRVQRERAQRGKNPFCRAALATKRCAGSQRRPTRVIRTQTLSIYKIPTCSLQK